MDPQPDNLPRKIISFRALVSGRVQGIGYRYFTKKMADRSGDISGSVRNLDDGRVEVIAEGPGDSLRRFIEMLGKGPPFSRVTDLEVTWNPNTQSTVGFTILP
jgi:acylphosphatase